MGEAKSHTFYRTFVLVSFLVFLVSLETAAKQDKSVVTGGTLTREDARFHEWIEPGEDKASKKMTYYSGKVYLMIAYKQPYFKIGYTTNLKRRRSNLQTGCPFPLSVYSAWEVNNKYEAEAAAHKALKKYNRGLKYPELPEPFKTEWFELQSGLTIEDVWSVLDGILRRYAR